MSKESEKYNASFKDYLTKLVDDSMSGDDKKKKKKKKLDLPLGILKYLRLANAAEE